MALSGRSSRVRASLSASWTLGSLRVLQAITLAELRLEQSKARRAALGAVSLGGQVVAAEGPLLGGEGAHAAILALLV